MLKHGHISYILQLLSQDIQAEDYTRDQGGNQDEEHSQAEHIHQEVGNLAEKDTQVEDTDQVEDMNQVVDTDQAKHIDPKEDIDLEHSIG
mgnify:FL=1